jgi:hypothetical protein
MITYEDRHNLRRIEKELSTHIEPIPKEVDPKLYVAESQVGGAEVELTENESTLPEDLSHITI